MSCVFVMFAYMMMVCKLQFAMCQVNQSALMSAGLFYVWARHWPGSFNLSLLLPYLRRDSSPRLRLRVIIWFYVWELASFFFSFYFAHVSLATPVILLPQSNFVAMQIDSSDIFGR